MRDSLAPQASRRSAARGLNPHTALTQILYGCGGQSSDVLVAPKRLNPHTARTEILYGVPRLSRPLFWVGLGAQLALPPSGWCARDDARPPRLRG
jgi:hypothetical protein